MVTEAQITDLVDKIVREFHPQKVILFGSYATGNPREDSDVDLFILMDFEGNPIDKVLEIRDKVKIPFATDLIVRTPEVLKQRLEWHDFFLMDIVEKGKVLYESDSK
jgi:predicted nucleotidyltransferase